MTQPTILISTGRTGTKFFAHLFADLFPQVQAFHDTSYSTLMNVLSNAHLARLYPRWKMKLVWHMLKGREMTHCDRDFFIDSNNHLYALVVQAPELYPDLKVIHIVRDPRTYVRSHLNWAAQRRKSYIANYWIPFWQPNAFLLGEMSWGKWRSLAKLARFGWIWDFKNRYMARLAQTDVPYLCVRFEDFFGGPEPTLYFNEMLHFIGLPEVGNVDDRFERPLNHTETRTFPKWPDWTAAQCAELQALCGKQMAAFGYGQEPAWQEKVTQGQASL